VHFAIGSASTKGGVELLIANDETFEDLMWFKAHPTIRRFSPTKRYLPVFDGNNFHYCDKIVRFEAAFGRFP